MIEELQAENENLMRQLAYEGIQLDVVSMLKMRLDYVTEFLLGDDEDRKAEFGLGWEKALNAALQGAVTEVNKAKLAITPPHQQLTLVDGLR